MVLSTFQSQTKLQKCFLLNIIELGGLKIAINNDMPTKYFYLYFNQLKFFQEYVLQMRKLRIKWKRKIENTRGIFLFWIS